MINTKPLVSIIMPVYNAEKFIEKTLSKLDCQTYKNIEVIVINDGSKDGTRAVLDRFIEKKDLSISFHVIHQDNMGICHTRNNGIELAKGKYIAFVDHDDAMLDNAIELLVERAEKTDADMVIGGFELVDTEGKVLEHRPLEPTDAWSLFRINAPWGRIFSKKVIEENNVRFFITKISEDFYFNYLFMSCCNKIEVIPQVVYQWLYSPASESHSNMSQFSEDRNVLAMLTALMSDMKKDNILKSEYVEFGLIKHVVWYMFYVAKSASKETLTMIHTNCIAWLDTYCPNYKKNPLLKWGLPASEGLKQRVFVKIAVMLEKMHLLNFFLHVYAGKLF